MAMNKNIKRARDWFFVTYVIFLFAFLSLYIARYDNFPDGQLYVGKEFIELYIASMLATLIFWGTLEYGLGVEGPLRLIEKTVNPPQSEDLSIPQMR